jgi:hypothetical protein
MQILTLEKNFERPVFTVYKTTNLINSKFYIGYHKTTNLDDDYLGSGRWLINSLNKYGEKSFIKETLFIYDNSSEALEKERDVIALYRNIDPLCMNLHPGGTGNTSFLNLGAKIGSKLKGRKHSEETLAKMRLAHHITDEIRAKLSRASTGRVCSKETRLKLSQANRGKNFRIGYKHSDETKQKISLAHKGKIILEETKARMSAAGLKRKPISEETRNKLRNRRHSEETKAKMQQAQLLRYQRNRELTGSTISEETRLKLSQASKNA